MSAKPAPNAATSPWFATAPASNATPAAPPRDAHDPVPTTVREIIRRLEDDGWAPAATKGSHRQFTHKIKKGRVTVPGKLSADLQPGTLKSILRQAGLKD